MVVWHSAKHEADTENPTTFLTAASSEIDTFDENRVQGPAALR